MTLHKAVEHEKSPKSCSGALNPRTALIKILMLTEKFQALCITCIMLILENLKLNQILFLKLSHRNLL
jgi:hypothetical protein